MVGDFGAAMIAVGSLAGLAVFGSYSFAFAALCYAAIADATAGGQDEVTWPDEPFIDRLGRAAGFAWLWAVTLAPLFVVGLVCARGRGGPAFLFALAVGPLLFSVAYLSVQASGSLVALLAPGVVARLFKRPGIFAGYVAAALPASLLFLFGAWLIRTRGMLHAVAGAFCLAFALFVFARLVGRLAQRLERVKLTPLFARPDAPPAVTKRPRVRAEVADPWAAPSEPADEPGYALRPADAPEPEPPPVGHSYKRVWVEEGADEPYALGDELKPTPLPESLTKVDEYELRLISQRREKLPRRPFIAGVWTFPLRGGSLGRLAALTAGLTLTAWCWQAVRTALAGG